MKARQDYIDWWEKALNERDKAEEKSYQEYLDAQKAYYDESEKAENAYYDQVKSTRLEILDLEKQLASPNIGDNQQAYLSQQ